MTLKDFFEILYNNLHGSFSKGVFTSELLNNCVIEDCDELPKYEDAYRKYFNSGRLSKTTIDVIKKYRDQDRFVNYLKSLIKSDDVLVDICSAFENAGESNINVNPKTLDEFCRSVSEQLISLLSVVDDSDIKNKDKKSKWITEGSDFNDFDKFDGFIYENYIVSEFLVDPQKYFIIAGKGVGKTVLLKYKRYLMEQRLKSATFLPSDRPYLDFVDTFTKILNDNEIKQFSDKNFCLSFWRVSLQIYLLSAVAIPVNTLANFFSDIESIQGNSINLKYHLEFLLRPDRDMITVVNYLISKLGESGMQKLFDVSYLITSLFRKSIHESVIYFFDRVDQAFKDADAPIWISMQHGLLEAAWDIIKSNPHVKIYMSLRQEAYDSFDSFNKSSMAANISLLQYSDNELKDLMLQLIKFYEGKDSFEEFLGINCFKNTVVHHDEDIYSFMNRYSIGRPRDFVIFGKSLSEKIESELKDRSQELKDTIIVSSSQSIISGLHNEVKMLLSCLETKEDFDSFLILLCNNVLTYDELRTVCKSFNGNRCCNDCYLCKSNNDCQHPFCDLYIMGLLGKVQKIDGNSETYKQIFKSPYEDITKSVTYSDSEFFLIHPALRNYIKALKKDIQDHYEVYDCLLIGDGLPWKKSDSQIVEIHKKIDCINSTKIQKFLISQLILYYQNGKTEKYSALTEKYNHQEFSTDNETSTLVADILKDMSVDKQNNIKTRIFISYAYDNDEHIKRVMSFTNMLRHMGFDAIMDQMLMNKHHRDLEAMMDDGLSCDKVIIVLSEAYKTNAEKHTGGVWREYRRILSDMEEHGGKYIFVSFDSFTEYTRRKILPNSISNSFIIDLAKDKENKYSSLISCITDVEKFPWATVNPDISPITYEEIPDFN
ncbi:MAG: TIR domain-containing protein [Oscillospiraceae bacterium]|jgi:hypothetical protein|nr:TIR domain-containing protein [Oscillospiraceae bacterium]